MSMEKHRHDSAEISDPDRLIEQLRREVAELKESQRRLLQTNDWLSDAMETLQEGFVVYDETENLVLCNKAYLDMFPGMEPAMVYGAHYDDIMARAVELGFHKLQDMTPDDYLQHRLDGLLDPKGEVYVQRAPNDRWLLSRNLRTAQNAVIAIRTDITNLISTENSLRESEERLKQQVSKLRSREERLEAQAADLVSLTENLTSARDELAELNDQKDRFFSIVAHDLKSPFNALLGFSQILATKAITMPPDKVAEYGSLVNRAADQAYKLLEDLLDWSRVQLDRVEFEPESVDIGTLINTNLARFDPAAAVKNIRIKSGTMFERPVYADAHMVDTILRNLISNAIKFTPENGCVSVTAEQSCDWAEIAVSDTGIGLSKRKISQLFRLDKVNSTVGTSGETGTGLGLHLCKELVERQGGQIRVESAKGGGSVFSFTLKMYADQPQ